MTMHLAGDNIKNISAQRIVSAWNYHGKRIPSAFVTLSLADQVAYQCWTYLDLVCSGEADGLTISKFCEDLPEDTKSDFEAILTAVVALVSGKEA